MTGYTVHTGSNDKFRDGWERIFKTASAKKSKAANAGKTPAAKPAAKKKKS